MLNKLYKKIFAGIITAAMVFSMIPAGAIEAGIKAQIATQLTSNKIADNQVIQQEQIETIKKRPIPKGDELNIDVIESIDKFSEATAEQKTFIEKNYQISSQQLIDLEGQGIYFSQAREIKAISSSYETPFETVVYLYKTYGTTAETKRHIKDLFNYKRAFSLTDDETTQFINLMKQKASAKDLIKTHIVGKKIGKRINEIYETKKDTANIIIEGDVNNKNSLNRIDNKEDKSKKIIKKASVSQSALNQYASKNNLTEDKAEVEIEQDLVNTMTAYATLSSNPSAAAIEKYVSAPFTYSADDIEQINLNTGGVINKQTDFYLKGRGGLDLNIATIYNSDAATMYESSVQQPNPGDIWSPSTYVNGNRGYTYYEKISGLGVGWRFAFSSIEVDYSLASTQIPDTRYKYLHTANGERYRIAIASNQVSSSNVLLNNQALELAGYEHYDMQLYSCIGSVSGCSTQSKFKLVYKDGKTEYFDANGKLMAIRDRFGNQITFNYNSSTGMLSSIIDTAGRTVNFIYSTLANGSKEVILTLPDNNQIKYTMVPTNVNATVNSPFDELSAPTKYVLFKKTDTLNRNTEFTYQNTVFQYNYFQKLVSYHGWGDLNDKKNEYVLLTQVKLPTNATLNYTYQLNPSRLNNSGMTEKSRVVTKNKTIGSNIYNAKVYTYGSVDYTGCLHTGDGYYSYYDDQYYQVYVNDNFSVPSQNVQTDNYTFNGYHKISTHSNGKTNKYYTYETNSALPGYRWLKRLDTTYYQSDNTTKSTVELFTHDAYGNVLEYYSPLAEGNTANTQYKTVYEYNNKYNLMTSKVYQKDSTTKIKEQYGGSSPYFSTLVPSSIAYELNLDGTYKNNGNAIERIDCETDEYGNVTLTKPYYDSAYQVRTGVQYYDNNAGRNGQLNGVYPTLKFVERMKDVDGNNLGQNVTIPDQWGTSYENSIAQNFFYDIMGNVTLSLDANSNVAIYTNDAGGRITSITNSDSSTATFAYDDVNLTTTVTDEIGHSIQKGYDGFGNLLYEKDVTGSNNIMLKQYTYDNMLRPYETKIYNNGSIINTIVTTYDTLSRPILTQTKNSTGTVLLQTQTSYDQAASAEFKRVTKSTSQLNQGSIEQVEKIEAIYDKNNNLLEERKYSNDNTSIEKTTYAYNYAGSKISQSSPRANGSETGTNKPGAITYVVNHNGKATQITDTLNNNLYTSYDMMGRVISTTDANGNISTNEYDSMSRLIRTKNPVTIINGTTYYIEKKLYYDGNGNLIKQLVSNNAPGATQTFAKTEYEYNNRNQLIKVIQYKNDTDKHYTQYTYDAVGNVKKMYTGLTAPLTISGGTVTPNGDNDYSVTTYNYDTRNRLVGLVDPLGQSETYSYDDLNRTVTKTDRNGSVTTIGYDAMGNMSSSQTDGAGSIADVNATYSYSNYGKLLSQNNANIGLSYTYDTFGRVSTMTQNNGIVKSYTYDDNGNRKTFVVTVGGIQKINTTYTYDKMDRLIGVNENGVAVATYTYDANGNRSSVTYSNGNSTNYTYNKANMVNTLINKQGSTAVSSYSYDYYLDGNQKSKTEGTGKVTNYAYDNLGRLTIESAVQGGTADAISYTYDESNNRKTMTVTGTQVYQTGYNYDKNNRLLNETKTAGNDQNIIDYYYDKNGNQIAKNASLISETTGDESITLTEGQGTNSAIEWYEYNALNQLTKSTVDGVVAQYTYQPDGLRYSKTVGSAVARFTWDGDQLAIETDGSNALQAKYIRGINGLYREDASGTKQYYLYNGHGDVVQLGNASGAITKTYDYDAFGNEKNIDPNDTNPMRYCGEYFDKETGTIYLRARYYDARIGRFISEDSVRGKTNDPLSLNLYTYCTNNPVMYSDPSGHMAQAVIQQLASTPAGQQILNQLNILASQAGVTVTTYIANNSPQIQQMVASAGNILPAVWDWGTNQAAPWVAEKGSNFIEATKDAGEKVGNWLKDTFGGGSSPEDPNKWNKGNDTQTTQHGAKRLAERGFTEADISLTKSTNTIKTQADGAQVYIKEVGSGRFNVIVEGDKGVVTALKNISQKSLDRLSNNYGWK